MIEQRQITDYTGAPLGLDRIPWQKVRKKPVIVEAYHLPFAIWVETLEGRMLGNEGDWLIRGINGELYPCKPDIFEKTYETVTP